MATTAANPLASGDTAYLYRAAIGPRAQDYYLRHFARFDGDGRAGTSWNWAAYWATLNWMVYRRMWGWALAYVAAVAGLALLIFGVGKLVLDYSDASAVLLALLLLTAVFVVPGLYGNAWFYSHCNTQVTAALRGTADVKAAATLLAAGAPDHRRLLLLGLGNAVVLALVLLVANLLHSTDSELTRTPALDPATQQRASGPIRQPAPVATAPVASAPVVNATVPVAPASAAASAPAFAGSAAAVAPQVAAVASASVAAPPAAPAKPAAERPALIQAADRAPVPATKPEAAPAAAAVATSQTPPPAPAKPAAAGATLRYVWVVQVGAYAEEANARHALEQVQSLGLEAGAESFETASRRRLTRVRVGPYTRQIEAEQAALRIKSLNLPALVIRQRP